MSNNCLLSWETGEHIWRKGHVIVKRSLPAGLGLKSVHKLFTFLILKVLLTRNNLSYY